MGRHLGCAFRRGHLDRPDGALAHARRRRPGHAEQRRAGDRRECGQARAQRRLRALPERGRVRRILRRRVQERVQPPHLGPVGSDGNARRARAVRQRAAGVPRFRRSRRAGSVDRTRRRRRTASRPGHTDSGRHVPEQFVCEQARVPPHLDDHGHLRRRRAHADDDDDSSQRDHRRHPESVHAGLPQRRLRHPAHDDDARRAHLRPARGEHREHCSGGR